MPSCEVDFDEITKSLIGDNGNGTSEGLPPGIPNGTNLNDDED